MKSSNQPEKGKKLAFSLLLICLLVLYWFFQPVLNERFGLNLPSLRAPGGQVAKPLELPEVQQPAEQAPPSAKQSAPSEDLLYGFLRQYQPNRYLSPAGLIYGPGSQEGHRLKHLERHMRDAPTRPGPHGVFDGGMEKALQVIDEGYLKAQSNEKTQSNEKKQSSKTEVTTEQDGARTIHTIDMGKRIGFVGGQEGKRRNQPKARRLRIVLEGKQVITAFPL